MKRVKIAALVYILAYIVGCGGGSDAGGVSEPVKEWTKQYGTVFEDSAKSIATDQNGNVYITGYTRGNIEAPDMDMEVPSFGDSNIFITKFKSDGTKEWTKQYGESDDEDFGLSITTDQDGKVYVVGGTNGDWDGISGEHIDDMFIIILNSDGTKVEKAQFGTDDSDHAYFITTDQDGYLYIAGSTHGYLENTNAGKSDIFIIKFKIGGSKVWAKQYGTDDYDSAKSIAIDKDGNVYITGYTEGDLLGNTNAGKSDIFITKFKSSGVREWTKQYGTAAYDSANSIVTDQDGNVYITGQMNSEIFISKFKSDGTEVWTKQHGTDKSDSAKSITIDEDGNLYIAGYTGGDLDGNTNAGEADIFIIKLKSDGTQVWTKEYGTVKNDSANAIINDQNGNLYVTGSTKGVLDGNMSVSIGDADIFLMKLSLP